jgi:hypothetical protein
VRVGDFGLARPFDTRITRFSKRAADTPTNLTSTGVVLGTPLYMAPEQYLGDPADARTDQFSFCVALHGAIWGARPFAGDTFTDLAASVLSGKIEPTPKGVRVAKRVREAIRRGLALAPGERWPAMDPLLRELAASPRKRLVWLPAAATGLAAAAGIGLVVTRSSGTPCDRDHLAGVWDDVRRAKVERGLVAMDLPFAPATAAEVMRLGDRYADAFLSARVGACEAHDSGQLKSDAYALENICFVLRKRDLDAIADRLEHPDPRIAAHAVEAMSNLMPVSRCSDREMLRLLVGPPDAKTRVAINGVIGELHAVHAALDLGDETMQLGPILKRARAVDAPAVRAEALELAGRYAAAIADFQNARHWLADAAADARSGHHDAAEASALAALLDVKHELRTVDDGLRQEARQAGERVRDRPEIEIARLVAEAAVDAEGNQIDDAKRELDAAIAIADKQYPDRDLRRGAPREAMIAILVDAGRAADAKPYADALLALRKGVLGENHPAFATATMLVGDIQAASRDVAAAIASYHRAIDIAHRAKAPRVEADALAHFAALHVVQGDTAAARALYARAIALDATAYSRPHPAPARRLVAAAALEAKLGNRAKASELYRLALAAQRAVYDAGDPRIAETERALAD